MDEPLRIDCDECAMLATPACDDCVVTFLCSPGDHHGVVIDVAERRALQLLADGGLAPELRLVRRPG